MRRRALLVLALVVPALAGDVWDTPAFSAQPAALLEAASQVKPPDGASVVYLLQERTSRLEADSRRSYTYHAIYRVLERGAVAGWSSVETTWRPWYQVRPTLRGRVITPDGAVHELDPNTIADAPAGGDSSDMYSDVRVLRAPLPGVTVGAVVEEEIALSGTASFFPAGITSQAYFGAQVPVEHSRFTLDYPAALPLRHVERLLPGLKTERVKDNGRIRLTFEHGPMDALPETEELLPPDVPPFPYVAFSTGASWREIAAAYSRIVERQLASADVSSLVEGAAAGTTEEVGAKLVAALNRHVRYTGVEFGDAAIVPRTPTETISRRFGDCKDKAVLLVAMLRARGIRAHVALLSAGPGRDIEPDLPGISGFDHVIVYIPGPPAYWVDATAEYARFGELPASDQGRLALIAAGDTQALVRTPEATPASNGVIETREIHMAEQGKGRVVETTELWGSPEQNFRYSYATTEPKQTREQLERYAKSMYLSEEAPSYEFTAPSDLSKRFRLRIQVTNAGRVATDPAEAVVAIPVGNLLDRLPGLFTEDKPAPRKHDVFLTEPHTAEWRYRIIPAPGYRPVALPESRKEALGVASFSQELETAGDGTVTVKLRFDVVTDRFTPGQFEKTAAAVREFRSRNMLVIHFEQTGEALLKAGRIGEAIGEFRRLAALHRDEALHRTQVARALLAAGAGESARAEALEATRIEPKSAQAFATLAWVLQHDLVGRRFKKGCDLARSETAYRRALEIEPDNKVNMLDLAILLEHAPDGRRYASKAKLDAAITEYRKLEGRIGGAPAENNILFALLWRGRFEEARDLARTRKTVPGAVLVAAVAGCCGAKEAIAEASARIATEQARREALAAAGQILVNLRMYGPAADLIAAGASGAPNAAALLASVEVFRRARRFEEFPEPAGAGDFLRAALATLFLPDSSDDSLKRLLASRSHLRADGNIRGFREAIAPFQAQVVLRGVPIEVAVDLAMSAMRTSVDEDGADGYRVRANMAAPAGSHTLTGYVIKENGAFRLWTIDETPSLGRHALNALEAGRPDVARRWLDWTRDVHELGINEDPLSGDAFARAWTKGQEASAERIRCAAAILIGAGDDAASAIPVLRACRDKAGADRERETLDRALSTAYWLTEDGEALLELSRRLLERHPKSRAAFGSAISGATLSRQWDAAKKLIAGRLAGNPEDEWALRAEADVAMRTGDFSSAIRAGTRLMELGKAGFADLNNLAWTYLLAGSGAADAEEIGRRAVADTQANSYGTLHTLACLYAEAGKLNEARDLILQGMNAAGEDEPSGSSWYVFGRIAEQYGIRQDAISAYNRLDRPKKGAEITSTWSLAQRRLAALNGK